MWCQRDLSIKGKITVLKSLALSQLLYITSEIYAPEDFIDRVDSDIRNFVWNNKPAKVKHSTMIGDVSDGGMKMPCFKNIVKSQKVMWV